MKVFFIIRFLAIFGVILAVYLLWEQFYHPTFVPCTINSTVNCNAIISGSVAKTLGIPTPLIGFIGYLAIFFATFWKARKVILGMVMFGLAFCLWIAYKELFLLHVICPVCVLCQIDMVSVFVLSLISFKKHTTT